MKRSAQVSVGLLLTSLALAGCGEDPHKKRYSSLSECAADIGILNCEMSSAPAQHTHSSGFIYMPSQSYIRSGGSVGNRSSSSFTSTTSAPKSGATSRGGFGATGASVGAAS